MSATPEMYRIEQRRAQSLEDGLSAHPRGLIVQRSIQPICSECDNPVRCQSGCTKNREAVPMRVVVDGVLMTHKDIQ